MFLKAHIEKIRRRIEDNEKYCLKEGSYHKYGTKPLTENKKKANENRNEQVALAEIDPDLCDSKLQLSHTRVPVPILINNYKKPTFFLFLLKTQNGKK